MFKRSEKKIKAVFKMRFQATQVPQLKAKSLMISLVPVDVGKPTVKLPKAPIVEGICTWEKPICETVKLMKEIKTGRIREKFYYVVVSTGSSKSGFLGEISIDFADLAEATKPLKLTLPLQTSKSGAILHVTVQKMQAESDSRHDEDNEASVGDSPDSEDFLSELASPHKNQNGRLEDAESDSNGTDSSMSGRVTNQMKMLEKKAQLSELEAESLRKQIVKETKQLTDQIATLKEESDSLKVECEELKMSRKVQNEDDSLEQQVKQALQRERQLNKKLKLQVQKTEDSNSEYVLTVRDLNQKLEQKNTEISRLSTQIKTFYSETKSTEDSEEERLKQKIQDYESLETENSEIYSKLEQNEKEKMEIQQNYTASLATLKQFKLKVARLEEETKRQAVKHSEYLGMIDGLEAQLESLQNELETQAQVFEEDLEMVSEAKAEIENRAIRAEEALRRMKKSNANEAERVQEEFKQLSAEKNDKNEKLEELLKKTNDELQITREKLEKIYKEYAEQKNLNLEVKKLRLKNNEVTNQLQEVELEKGNLKKEITILQSDLRNKKQGLERSATQNSMAEQKNDHSDGSCDVSSLLSEVTSLKERNKKMESELKEMHEKYSEVSLRFAEVEGERQQLALAVRNLKIGKKT